MSRSRKHRERELLRMEELLSRKKVRADSYKLLRDCYYLPNKGLIDRLKGLDGSASGLAKGIKEIASSSDKLELLEVDFSHLFVGPFKLLAPPYGSLYLENTSTVMGNSTIDAKKRYSEEGLEINLKEVPDHIAIELEFMYFLISKELERAESGETQESSDYRGKEELFLRDHLARWVGAFADNIIENAETPFYKKLAYLTKEFIEEDLKRLSLTEDVD